MYILIYCTEVPEQRVFRLVYVNKTKK